ARPEAWSSWSTRTARSGSDGRVFMAEFPRQGLRLPIRIAQVGRAPETVPGRRRQMFSVPDLTPKCPRSGSLRPPSGQRPPAPLTPANTGFGGVRGGDADRPRGTQARPRGGRRGTQGDATKDVCVPLIDICFSRYYGVADHSQARGTKGDADFLCLRQEG